MDSCRHTRELERLAGGLSTDKLEAVIAHSKAELKESRPTYSVNREEASAIILTKSSYDFLEDLFPGAVSDAHRIQLLLAQFTTFATMWR